MTTEQMEWAISNRYNKRIHLMVPNISWGALPYEADVLVVRESGYCIEFEIKQSFADFKNDFKKHKWQAGLSKKIKEFYYVFPAELWHKRENDIRILLPDFAGVIVVYNGNSYDLPNTKKIKSATPNKYAIPLSSTQMYNVARLGTMRIWKLKRRLISKQLLT